MKKSKFILTLLVIVFFSFQKTTNYKGNGAVETIENKLNDIANKTFIIVEYTSFQSLNQKQAVRNLFSQYLGSIEVRTYTGPTGLNDKEVWVVNLISQENLQTIFENLNNFDLAGTQGELDLDDAGPISWISPGLNLILTHNGNNSN